ncbi:MAG: hypothetical protein CBC29_05730 [Methylococcaceae bacterium TMED69]|nr:MAG: hypothetical protein CBC29_05730 [Methylococcaceae bacterium TMED69]|tara:strand:- start:827 stop:1828 length:1002 start_codon:yes stop_codon:yes gene_type:complete
MALNDASKINISLKKLSGKAHTSNDKGLPNEGLPSNVTLASSTIFGETIPSSPTANITNPFTRSGTGTFQVEYVRLIATYIPGTDTPAGKHGFKLSLPSDYATKSSHGPTGAFVNNADIYSSNGALQLVPPSFGTTYEAKPYYGTVGSGTLIPVLDDRDWTIDYFNGILFQQDPPADTSQNPTYVDAFIYIGDYLNTVVTNSAGGAPTGGEYVLGSANGGLSSARVLTAGEGISITTNASPRQIIVNSTGLTSRTKAHYDVAAGFNNATNFACTGINFSDSVYDASRIDIYLNGQLLRSGSSYDYVLAGPTDTDGVDFKFNLKEDDVVGVVLF